MTDAQYLIRKNQEIREALRDAFVRGAHWVAPQPRTVELAQPEAERLYPDFDPKELTL